MHITEDLIASLVSCGIEQKFQGLLGLSDKRAEKVSMLEFGFANIRLLCCSSRPPYIAAAKKIASYREEITCGSPLATK